MTVSCRKRFAMVGLENPAIPGDAMTRVWSRLPTTGT